MREFQECRTLFTALGDETRQYLVCILLNCGCGGIRVAQLAERTNLSRPAISHHIQILKRAGIVASRREGTQIYYSLAPESHLVEKAIRLRADMVSPWLPVVMMHTLCLGRDLIWVRSISTPSGIFI